MALNDDLRSDAIKHSVYLHRYTVGTVRKLITLLNKTDADIVRQILDSTPTSKARLNDLLASVRSINLRAYEALSDGLTDELESLVVYEADFQDRLIGKAAPVTLATTIPAEETLIAAVHSRPFQGRLLKEWIKGASDAGAARTRDAIRLGVVEGQTTAQIAQRIRGTKALNYTDGILEISRRGVAAMVRTAVNHTATTARELYFQDNADIIAKEQWVSTLDGKTSAVCRSRDGEVFPIGKGPRPPAHIGCRSTMAPVVKSWRELGIDLDDAPPGTRASMDGQESETETYQSWLKKQPAPFQNETLGKTKGQLFRKGGLTLDKFVDRNGNELSLDQLRKTEAQAFERI